MWVPREFDPQLKRETSEPGSMVVYLFVTNSLLPRNDITDLTN